jgi:hypothetical protein
MSDTILLAALRAFQRLAWCGGSSAARVSQAVAPSSQVTCSRVASRFGQSGASRRPYIAQAVGRAMRQARGATTMTVGKASAFARIIERSDSGISRTLYERA